MTLIERATGIDKASDFQLTLPTSWILLMLILTFTIEASMINHPNYNKLHVLSGNANNLFYNLSSDQVAFNIPIINLANLDDIQTNYLYKFF